MQNELRSSAPSVAAIARALTLLRTIGAKIFGLAVFLQLLTIILVIFLLYQGVITQRKMQTVVALDLPLAQATMDINESGLRRRLALERWLGALNAADPNPEVIAEASANFALFTTRLQDGFKTAHELLDRYPPDMANRPELVEVRTLLGQIEATYNTIIASQPQILDLLRARQTSQVNLVDNLLYGLQKQLQEQRTTIQQKTYSMSIGMMEAVKHRQLMVMQLAIGTTIAMVLLGLVLAALITVRLTRPVRSLTEALGGVQQGLLDVELPVTSRDEVGELTQGFNFFIGELRAKEQLKKTFGKYIDPRVLEQLLKSNDDVAADGGRRVMSVLFADIMGFTTISERLTPSMMVSLLNRHFGLQSQAIQAHQGVVDKFIGDAVMAFWGPPFTDANMHAALACRSALAQIAALDVLRRELSEITGLRKDAPVLNLCIGIGTGDVVVGNIGSENTRSYTVIGDTVNLASRIESSNRYYGTHILLSEDTAHAAGAEFELREVDSIEVKGKSEVTRIFELLGAAGELSATVAELRDHYAEALRCYRAQDWAGAESLFLRCLELKPDDGPARVMLERLPALRMQVLPPDWNAVFHLTEK